MDKDFNPYENRNVEKPLLLCDAFMTLLKCLIGTGILAMPLNFKSGGLIGGVILTILCTALIIYGMLLLVKCMVECSRRNQMGYMNLSDSMEYSLSLGPRCCKSVSRFVSTTVDVILCVSQYGVNVVYHVFVAINLKQLSDRYITVLDLKIICAIVGLFMLPLFLVRQLKYLVPVTIIANILVYFGLVCISYYMLRYIPPFEDRLLFPKVLDVPMFLAIVMFATSSVGVTLAVESKMANPKRFLGWFGVMTLAAGCVCITNIFFGFIGYWNCGEETEESITLNLPENEILAQIVQLLMLLAVYFTYPLSGYVSVDIIVNNCISKKREVKNIHMVEYLVRIAFVIVCTLNAVAFPNLGPLVALVGAFSISTLNLIFPCCMNICLHYGDSYGRLKWILWKDIIIILIGSIVLFCGSFFAIRDIIHAYSPEKK